MKKGIKRATRDSLIDENNTFKIFSLTQTHQLQDARVMISPSNDNKYYYNHNNNYYYYYYY